MGGGMEGWRGRWKWWVWVDGDGDGKGWMEGWRDGGWVQGWMGVRAQKGGALGAGLP